MISRSVAVGLFAAGCLTAAAGGSYLAVRQNTSERMHAQQAVPVTTLETAPAEGAPAGAVTETEAVVTPDPTPAAPEVRGPAPAERKSERAPAPRRSEPTRKAAASPAPPPSTAAESSGAPLVLPDDVPAVAPLTPEALPAAEAAPPAPVEPIFDEIVIPASSVIGLELERTITSEQAQLEDRVDARVTRDVYASGRLAIPAGSRVTGNVTLVERGGKVKDRARLGVRFHTVVLADGRRVPLRTEPVFREGHSPGAESSRKIGGAAIGGAVLGAILGGGKGAATGAAVGAAGGTAAVMAGGRNAAVLPGGSVVTVRLSGPVVIELER